MSKRWVQVFLEFEIEDDSAFDEGTFEESVAEWIEENDVMHTSERGEDALDTLSTFVGFNVYDVRPGTTEGMFDDSDDESDSEEDDDYEA